MYRTHSMYRKLKSCGRFIRWFCPIATGIKFVGGKRLTKQQVDEIRYRSVVLHQSERVIALEMGISKSAVHRVLTDPRIEGVQDPKKSFSPVQQDGIADEGFGKRRSSVADGLLSYPERSPQIPVTNSDFTTPRRDFRALAEHVMRLVLQSNIDIQADAIEPFIREFMQDLPEFLASPERLENHMYSHFGPIAGKNAFQVFIGFRPKLLSMRVIQLSRS